MSDRRPSKLGALVVDPDLYASDPYPLFARLRRDEPIAWNAEFGFWAIAKHRDVSTVEADHQTFSSSKGILVDEIGSTYESPPTIMHTDPPAHTRYRRLVSPGFKASVVKAMEDSIRHRAAELIENIEAGKNIDIVSALSVPLPLLVISEILGVPDAEWRRCFEWSEAVIPGATDCSVEKRNQLMADMIDYLVTSTKARREDPRKDVLSELAAAHIDGDQLNDAELAMFLVQLLVAGNETTRNMISGGLVAFADNPKQWKLLRERSEIVTPAVEEMLRWTTPVVSFMRMATRDTRLGDQSICAGDPVLMLFASANRDEEVFGDSAETFDISRDPNPHIAFGFGSHFCLGAALARLEGRIVLEELSRRFADVQRAGPVVRSGSSVIAGVKKAELVFYA